MSTPAQLVNEDASLIGRKVFCSEQIYGAEKRQIFGRNWLYLAHTSQLRAAGDFVQAYMGETPVVVTRTEEMNIAAFINSCVHRGLPVCRHDHGNSKRFLCPYHHWSYHLDGRLAAVPQERQLQQPLDKTQLGMKQVPRIEQYHGLIFACMDPDAPSLASALGDMRFYLDAYFLRFPEGVEVMGPPHKWLLNANWKLPVENQLGDVNHGPFLHHATLADSPAVDEINNYGYSVVPAAGHGATFRLMPDSAPLMDVAWGMEGVGGLMGGAVVQEYLRELQMQAVERVGPIRAQMKGLTYGVFPNLSFLWSNTAIRVSHPRGPGQTEYWSWCLVPCDAPNDVKAALRQNYNYLFGPGGLLEQEDAEVWAQQYKGSALDYADDRPYFYGMGLGEETEHPELPGKVSHTANEHYARAFYQRWRDTLQQDAEYLA